LGLPGYGVTGWDLDDSANRLILSIRQTAPEPYYVCGGRGIAVREIHSGTERRLRDLPWGTWTVWPPRPNTRRVTEPPRPGPPAARGPPATSKTREDREDPGTVIDYLLSESGRARL